MARLPLSFLLLEVSAKDILCPLIYLFIYVLCAWKLSCSIDSAVNNCLWTPIKITASTPSISHLLFANDIILYMAVDSISCAFILPILKHFESVLGKKINMAKSKLFFSKNVPVLSKEKVIYDLNI